MQCNAMQIPESFLEIFRIFSLIPAILKFQNIWLSINLLHLLVWALSGSFSLNFTWKFSRIVLFCNFYYMDMMDLLHWCSLISYFCSFFQSLCFYFLEEFFYFTFPLTISLKFLFNWNFYFGGHIFNIEIYFLSLIIYKDSILFFFMNAIPFIFPLII